MWRRGLCRALFWLSLIRRDRSLVCIMFFRLVLMEATSDAASAFPQPAISHLLYGYGNLGCHSGTCYEDMGCVVPTGNAVARHALFSSHSGGLRVFPYTDGG